MKTLLKTLLLFLVFPAFTQSDSTLLFAERLGINDIKTDVNNIGSQKIVSASRSLQSVEDLPFTVYVITKEDIRNNGYNTLVDALKMVPGIRVSQVGSGVDGETFLMRGLRGNSYTKILINNIPVKPIGVKGMALGAQLPIRQAERIEVIFGPAATLYGADASAGVINIILKESERPLYTKADISFGAEGYNAMNILFGGKAGKGKKVLKYNVFGNYTAFNDRRIFLDYGPLYSPESYSEDSTSYLNNPNYLTRDENSNLPARSSTPHLSRLFGMELSLGAFDLTVLNMYRRDHSSLGLNPVAFSYSNPLNYIGETTNQVHLAYNRKKKKRAFNIALNFLQVESDKSSSYRIINSDFSKALVLAAESDYFTPGTTEEKIYQYFDNFTSGDRYIYDRKIDISLETTWNAQISNQVEWMTGVTPRLLVSTSEYFLRTPYPNFFEDHTITRLGGNTGGEIGVFTQVFFNTPKFKSLLGLQTTVSTAISSEDTKLYPRLALLYKINPKLSIRGFFGTAFRTPSTYFSKNSYTINVGNYEWISLGDTQLRPEITNSLEGGIRWNGGEKFHADLNIFTSSTMNFIRPDLIIEQEPFSGDVDYITLGYFNKGSYFSKISGIQSAFVFRNIIPRLQLNTSLHLTATRGLSLLSGDGEEDDLREQPKLLAQLKISFSPIKGIFFHLDNLYISKTHNQSLLNEGLLEYTFLPQFFTTDISILGRLTDHFQVNFKLKNATNTYYAGLAATGTPDDLLWNQQSLRTWELGFSYRME